MRPAPSVSACQALVHRFINTCWTCVASTSACRGVSASTISSSTRAGKVARHPDEFAKILSDAGLDSVLHVTERRHHAVELARDAIDQGYGYLVAVGGGETIHEVVNGMMGPDGPRNPDADLGDFCEISAVAEVEGHTFGRSPR